ncbi:sensor histidine kinase [Micromonospora sp. NBC_01813]|uniref:sensor histidine kinase n=1 Tax=Micromonospora sp. NBC_01813 TaxID=2975988 RepID=UPI002DDA55D6|nr:sensor histidine kinase [Micromonospora sp. NBC_01813]WSA08639.1 sensor histidine kinase [Micromonospora sp. NBC_01813]
MTRALPTAAVHTHSGERRRWRVSGSIVRLLQLLVAVPLVAVVGFAGLALQGTVRDVVTANRVSDLVLLSTEAGSLARALQAERVIAAVELTAGSEAASASYAEQVTRTDAAIVAFQQRRTGVAADNAVLRRVDAGLNSLTTVREQVRSSPRVSLSAIAFSYRILIADLLAFRTSVAAETSPETADEVRAAAAVSEAGEAIGQQQIIVLRSLLGGELTPAGQQESAGAQARFVEASNSFLELADPQWVVRWEQIGTDPLVVAGQQLQDQVGRTLPGERFALNPDTWVEATDGWISQLFGIQRAMDTSVADAVAAEGQQRFYTAVLQGAGILLVLILTAVLTSVVARRITRRLRSLRNIVTTVAYDRLPAVVRELDAAPAGTVHPEEFADRSVSEFPITGNDEIAEVATATRALHREAVRVAGVQAVLRSNVAEIFVHLSRREQRLVDAMLAQVDQVERDETDPDRLEQLYRLDHLATRMARINQSLLVLGGSGISRVRQEAVPLDNVIQAALSQIEHYTRVRIGTVDRELSVAGKAVDEVAHLLAELLDNATRYSPPETEVIVTGHALSDRAIVEVMDQGVGLSAQRCEQLTAQLASPGTVDVSGVRAMGLTVVARLADRHGVRVELHPGTPAGTVAEVMMPASVISRRPVQQPEPVAAGAGQVRPSMVGGRPVVPSVGGTNPPYAAAGVGRAVINAGRATVSAPAPLFRPAPESPAPPASAPTSPDVPAPFSAPPPQPPPSRPPLPSLPAPVSAPPPALPPLPTSAPPSVPISAPPGVPTSAPPGVPATAPVGTSQPVGAVVVKDRNSVNGWFKTALDGDSVTVTWPDDKGRQWTAATAVASAPDATTTSSTPDGLPRRVPKHHLIPDAPQPAPAAPRKLDPGAVSAAMSAYAKGVAGRRAPTNPS